MAGPRRTKIVEWWRGLFGPSSATRSPAEGVKDAAHEAASAIKDLGHRASDAAHDAAKMGRGAAHEAKAKADEVLHREGGASPTPFAGASSALSGAAATARERGRSAANEITSRLHDVRERGGTTKSDAAGGTAGAVGDRAREAASAAANLAREVTSRKQDQTAKPAESNASSDDRAEATSADEALSGTGGSSWSASESGLGPAREQDDALPDAEGAIADLDRTAAVIPGQSDDPDALVGTDGDVEALPDREIDSADDWTSSRATAAYVEDLGDAEASPPDDLATSSGGSVPAGDMANAESAGDAPAAGGSMPGDGTTNAPPGYPIKGNGNSKIYHMPGQSSYDATIPEMCFATEADAVAAGFRPRKR